MVVAMASALMVIISKYGFMDAITLSSVHVEVSHIAAGVVQAIGFIGAGVIFVKGDNIIGLTTAAGLWTTVGVGLAVGSGLYFLGISSTLLILLIELLVHRKGNMSHYTEAGHIEVNLTKNNMSLEEAEKRIEDYEVVIRNSSHIHNKEGESIFSASISCSSSLSIYDTVNELINSSFVETIQIYAID